MLAETIKFNPVKEVELNEASLDERIKEYYNTRLKFLTDQDRKNYKKQNFYPYDMGVNCNAYHYFTFELWDQRPSPDATLREIFQEGHIHEKSIREKMESGGWKISQINLGLHIEWENCYRISGKIDMIVDLNGASVPVEAKSMSPHIYDSLS